MSAQHRIWFITGCSSGFGLSLAAAVLARGHCVIATARKLEQLDELVAAYPETCLALALDVTDSAQVKMAVARARYAYGRLDIIVNNAGYGLVGALEELGDEQIARNFDTNFFGALEVIRAALPILRAQHSGHIVNISAAAVISNYAGFSIYGASEVGVRRRVGIVRRRTKAAWHQSCHRAAGTVSHRVQRSNARKTTSPTTTD